MRIRFGGDDQLADIAALMVHAPAPTGVNYSDDGGRCGTPRSLSVAMRFYVPVLAMFAAPGAYGFPNRWRNRAAIGGGVPDWQPQLFRPGLVAEPPSGSKLHTITLWPCTKRALATLEVAYTHANGQRLTTSQLMRIVIERSAELHKTYCEEMVCQGVNYPVCR